MNTISTIDLPGGSLLPVVPAHGETMRVIRGRVWLTEEGGLSDAFLASGDQQSLTGNGLIVIEALSAARIEIITPEDASVRAALLLALRRVAGAVAGALRRLPRALLLMAARARAGGTLPT